MTKRLVQINQPMLTVFYIIILCFYSVAYAESKDPLPSWNKGLIKKNIIEFVTQVTDKNNSNYVVPEQRIATFDNDGTLWIEKPLYTQAIFMFDRIKKLAPQHPEWKNQAPFNAILNNDIATIEKFSIQDITRILAVTHSGMSPEAFKAIVKDWLMTTKNSHFNRLYTELIYQPMLEVMNYLRDNDFKVYIVTGGGQDFVRAFSLATYGVSPDKVIGTMTKTRYSYQNNTAKLTKTSELFIVDDKNGKPIAINMFIGMKPLIAFGNSDGDQQMLEWTQSGKGARLMLLVHHDDARREFAYGPESKVGTFSNALMNEAKNKGWNIISMKNDWKTIFPASKN